MGSDVFLPHDWAQAGVSQAAARHLERRPHGF
jgi:hypothetical protein